MVLLACVQASAGPPLKILKEPVLGLLTVGVDAEKAAADRDQLARFFATVRESKTDAPKCNVLFLYARIDARGAIEGTTRDLRTIIHDSGASIVVIASENDPDHYLATSHSEPHKGIFLVMTIERRARTKNRRANKGVPIVKAYYDVQTGKVERIP